MTAVSETRSQVISFSGINHTELGVAQCYLIRVMETMVADYRVKARHGRVSCVMSILTTGRDCRD